MSRRSCHDSRIILNISTACVSIDFRCLCALWFPSNSSNDEWDYQIGFCLLCFHLNKIPFVDARWREFKNKNCKMLSENHSILLFCCWVDCCSWIKRMRSNLKWFSIKNRTNGDVEQFQYQWNWYCLIATTMTKIWFGCQWNRNWSKSESLDCITS